MRDIFKIQGSVDVHTLRGARRPRAFDLAALVALAATSIAAPGCVASSDLDPEGENLGTAESALIKDPNMVATVPGVAAPANMGTYCSVTDPSNGGWAFTWRGPGGGDPCVALAAIVGPNTVVRRAGLYADTGWNNVMVRCDGNIFYNGVAYGQSAMSNIYANVANLGAKNCVFNASPTRFFVWGPPMPAGAPVLKTTVFDYDYLSQGWSTAPFGRSDDGHSISIDRTGQETQSSFPTEHNTQPIGTYNANEGAYDWSVARDTPIIAVADGIIRGSQQRVVQPQCGTFADGSPKMSLPGSLQLELFLETQIGTGQYAEHFIAAYHHMDASPVIADPFVMLNTIAKWGGPMPPVGTIVKKGDIIGFVGESGCSAGGSPGAHSYHLDFSVLRLTNLTGGRGYKFQPLLSSYDANGQCTFGCAGVNGIPGATDPFGWAPPGGVDPDSYMLIGVPPQYNQSPTIGDMGSYSAALFDPVTFFNLPHNGTFPN